MSKKKSEDSGPRQSTEFDGPFNRIKDVHAGDPSGGPVNPTRDADPDYADETEMRTSFPWEADPTADVDDSSASAVLVVNELREAGTPLNQKDDSRTGDHAAGTPAGTGVSAGAAAGTATT